MMTYKIPDSIRQIAEEGEFNEFDLNVFFKAEGKGKNAGSSTRIMCRNGSISSAARISKRRWTS